MHCALGALGCWENRIGSVAAAPLLRPEVHASRKNEKPLRCEQAAPSAPEAFPAGTRLLGLPSLVRWTRGEGVAR